MRLAEREVKDCELIKAILDMCDVLNIAFFDDEYPYNLPVNFGYEFGQDLVFYCHHARDGYKNRLVENNPKVCVLTHRFIDHAYNSYDQSNHDYRSVMAFGEISFIDPHSDEYLKAWQVLCSCNGRAVPDRVLEQRFRYETIRMSRIVCPLDRVFCKAQRIITSLEQLPFRDDPRPDA